MGTYADQHDIELRFSKNQLNRKIDDFFKAKPGFIEYIDTIGMNLKFALTMLRTLALHKRTTPDVMFGVLSHYSNEEIEDNLLKALAGGLVKYEMEQFIVVMTLDYETQMDIDKYQYPLPMIIEPRKLTHNASSAYILPMGSLILKNNHHQDDIGIDVLNAANSVALKFNEEVILNMKNSWANIDKPKEGEDLEKFEKRKRAFAKYNKVSIAVIAELAGKTAEFYFTHKRCKRGRMYCQGYHLNYQGHTWNKANILFVEGEMITE